MAKLTLKFENAILGEMPVNEKEVSIGRSPDNAMVIDNPAVSHYHARVFNEEGRMMIEDFGSMNGTFVNGQRVKMVMLKPGDSVTVGKHTIIVSDSRDLDGFAVGSNATKPAAPKINETVMLDTKERREFLQKVAAVGESSQVAPGRVKVGTLVVRRGKTDRSEYALTDKLTVVGKSALATVKMKGWFAPKVAAVINKREGKYFIAASERDVKVKVNNSEISGQKELNEGDMIEVAGVKLTFSYAE